LSAGPFPYIIWLFREWTDVHERQRRGFLDFSQSELEKQICLNQAKDIQDHGYSLIKVLTRLVFLDNVSYVEIISSFLFVLSMADLVC
jgi:hypothetical protein